MPTITVMPPDYAKNTIETQTIQGISELSALQHSRLTFDFRFNRPAVAAHLEWTPRASKKGKEASTTVHLLAMSDGQRAEVIGPSLNKLRSFTTRTALRLMLGQSQGVRLDEVFAKRRILTFRLMTENGKCGSRSFGVAVRSLAPEELSSSKSKE